MYMADAGDYECRLLADLLPTCLAVADFFAGSNDIIAVEARAGTDAFTFYQNLYYEFCRLQAGQIVTYDGSLTVLRVGVRPLLEMLESRTPRVSHVLPRNPGQFVTYFIYHSKKLAKWLSGICPNSTVLQNVLHFSLYQTTLSMQHLTLAFSHLYGRHGYVKALSKDSRLCDPKLGSNS